MIAKAIARPQESSQDINTAAWLDAAVEEYQGILESEPTKPGIDEMLRLLQGDEPKKSCERVWNWRKEPEIQQTLHNRGHSYNGYPVSAGYFGSYCFDAVALALFSIRSTTSFDAAAVRTAAGSRQ